MQNQNIQTACEDYVAKKMALEQASEHLLKTAENEFAKVQNITIGETVLKLHPTKDLKGVIVGIEFSESAGEEDSTHFQFKWKCQLINKDGKLSNSFRYYPCDETPVFAQIKWLNP